MISSQARYDHFDTLPYGPVSYTHLDVYKRQVIGRKEGKWMHYSISENGVQYAIDCLQALMITSAAFENKSCCDR